jgi:hypothetical protein
VAEAEGPAATEEIADLAAGDHQRGYDQRVERDHRLDW